MSEQSYSEMSDADLDASLTGETLDLDADGTATTPADEESAAGDEDQEATDDQQQGGKPDGWTYTVLGHKEKTQRWSDVGWFSEASADPPGC